MNLAGLDMDLVVALRALLTTSTLDPKIAALLQLAILVATGSSAVCLEWSAARALGAGATDDEIADVLLAIAPVTGLGRVVCAAPDVATALGYDERIGLSQPATSAALARLRRHFGDELLARKGSGYELTALGVVLLDRTEVACEMLELVFGSQPRFDPAREHREFVLLTSDYALAVVGDQLAREVSAQAPEVRITFRQVPATLIEDPAAQLAAVDGLFMPHGIISGLPAVELFRDRWLCAVAEDNPEATESITLDQLAALPWATYQRVYDAPVTRQLSLLGIEPRVQVSVDSFQALPAMVVGTRRVAMIQARLAACLGLGLGSGIRLLDCPFEAVPVQEALWWHPMHTHDAGHLWLRETAGAVAARLVAPG